MAVCCFAQTADDYFHRGAQLYIFGKKPEAKAEIGTGLTLFPADPKLNAMASLLKKEEQQQQQQQQQAKDQQQKQQQNQQQQQAQQDQSQQKQDSSQKNQQPQTEQKQQDQQQQQQQQQQQSGAQPKPEQEEKEREAAAYASGQMTPEQAQRLLDAQKGEEKMLPVKPEGKPTDQRRPIKDW